MDKLIITLMFFVVGLVFLIKSFMDWTGTIFGVLCLILGFMFGGWSVERIGKNLYT